MLKLFGRNPFTLFYIVFGYIITFSIWWGYLLFAKNETAFQEGVALDRINYESRHIDAPYEETTEYKLLYSKFKRQRIMILTEGSVFLILQILGLWQVRRIFAKEIELAAQQRNFLHSITHELKSPLSSIKLTLQTIIKRTLEPEQKSKLVNNAIGDVVRLESLVENMLFAAKIERDTHGFSSEELDLSEVTQTVVQKFSDNKKGIEIVTDIKDELYYLTDRIGFTSVVINLIENAIKYSDAGGKILLKLADQGNEILLEVRDTGYGIPEAEKLKVFDKFYRVGNEDTRNTKGTGLGLYIVKRFVEIYKGRIDLSDNSPKGTVFSLYFPK